LRKGNAINACVCYSPLFAVRQRQGGRKGQ
jgi:hypothetical protein